MVFIIFENHGMKLKNIMEWYKKNNEYKISLLFVIYVLMGKMWKNEWNNFGKCVNLIQNSVGKCENSIELLWKILEFCDKMHLKPLEFCEKTYLKLLEFCDKSN